MGLKLFLIENIVHFHRIGIYVRLSYKIFIINDINKLPDFILENKLIYGHMNVLLYFDFLYHL